jgi:glycosyltransferase involved in cell wall biosynthesis
MSPDNGKRSVRFINTFDTSAPFLGDVISGLNREGWSANALVSDVAYRETPAGDDADAKGFQTVWIPPGLRGSRRSATIAYAMLAPLYLMALEGRPHVFLTQPPLFFIPGTWIASLRRAPYVIHVMDLYPDLWASLKLLDESGFVYRRIARLADRAMARAEGIVAIGRCMRDRLIARGVDPERIAIVPNWAPDNVTPIPPSENEFLESAGLRNKFVVLYMGNMGYGHDFATALEAAGRLRGVPEILFLFVGRGARRKEVEQEVARGAPNIRLMDHQPLESLPEVLSAAAVHLISLRPGFEGIMVPSKFYSALASGRPILYVGSQQGEVARAIREVDCGVVVRPGDVDTLCDAILRYHESNQVAEEDGLRARSAHETLYRKEIGVKKYVETVTRWLGQGRG